MKNQNYIIMRNLNFIFKPEIFRNSRRDYLRFQQLLELFFGKSIIRMQKPSMLSDR